MTLFDFREAKSPAWTFCDLIKDEEGLSSFLVMTEPAKGKLKMVKPHDRLVPVS